MWTRVLLLALALTPAFEAGSATAEPPPGGVWCRGGGAGRNLRTLDATAGARLAGLVAASATTREMVATICAASDVHITLSGARGLKREHRYGGLSVFAIVDGVLIGRLAFDISETTRESQRVTVAHELAHAVELALLPRSTTRALARRLLTASGRHPAWWPHQHIETPFAVAVERQVAAELRGYAPHAGGSLEHITRAHGVHGDDRDTKATSASEAGGRYGKTRRSRGDGGK